MEYAIGFLFTLFSAYCVAQLHKKYNIFYEFKKTHLRPSQSHNHNLLKYSFIKENIKINTKSQSKIHDSKINIRVIIMDNQAYWIKDNAFYTADIRIDGNVDKDTTRVVDTMAMNSVQLDKMMFILDRLREEAFDDRGGSGY